VTVGAENNEQDRNIVLAHTYEYRHPSPRKVAEAAESAAAGSDKVTLGMTSRCLGLVVVPGKYIVKIEVEEFLSQLRRGGGDLSGGAAAQETAVS